MTPNTPPETTAAELLEAAKELLRLKEVKRKYLHERSAYPSVQISEFQSEYVAKKPAAWEALKQAVFRADSELAALKAQQHEAVAWQLRYPAYLERPATEWVPITQKQFDRIDGLTGTFEVRALYANPKAQQPSGAQAGMVNRLTKAGWALLAGLEKPFFPSDEVYELNQALNAIKYASPLPGDGGAVLKDAARWNYAKKHLKVGSHCAGWGGSYSEWHQWTEAEIDEAIAQENTP